MADLLAFVLIPLLLYVAVPVGIISAGFAINRHMPLSPIRRWGRLGIGLITLFLAGLWISDVQNIIDWLWYMAFGGGWAGLGRR